MNPQLASSSRLRRSRLWAGILLWTLFFSSIAFFLLSNLWLQSNWGRQWLGNQITQRIGLPVEIGGAGWLPGGQVWIDDLRVVIPSTTSSTQPPLLQIRCFSVRPAWGAWLRGSRKISDVCVSAPRLHLPVDVLKSLLPTPGATMPEQAATVAQTPPTPTHPPVVATAPTVQASTAAPTLPADPPSPTTWLKISEGHLAIVHPSQTQPLLEIDQIDANLPIAGAPAAGHLQSGAIAVLNQIIAPFGHIALHWQYPLWDSEVTRLSCTSLQADAKIQVARVAGLPFGVVITQTPQAWRSADGIQQLGKIQSQHRLSGFLLGPQTWHGDSLWEAQQIKGKIRGHDLNFFAAQSRLVLQSGVLQCTDFRLLGDDYSLLGNGLYPLRGPSLGIVRITAPRATANQWELRWQQVFPEVKIALQPMFNEDRRAIDVVCGGTLAQPWLSFDQGKTMLDLQKILLRWQQKNTPPPP